jgi:hypothetical protein
MVLEVLHGFVSKIDMWRTYCCDKEHAAPFISFCPSSKYLLESLVRSPRLRVTKKRVTTSSINFGARVLYVTYSPIETLHFSTAESETDD